MRYGAAYQTKITVTWARPLDPRVAIARHHKTVAALCTIGL